MIRNIGHLRQLQSLPLEQKIILTEMRIKQWYSHFKGNVYVSFSGGKDSTVLLDICRKIYPNIPAVFFDTGLEYPEIRDFVKTKDNIVWIKPDRNFKEIIMNEGYPVVSKEVSQTIREAKLYDGKKYSYRVRKLDGEGCRYNFNKYKYLLNAPFTISEKCCYYMKKKPAFKYERESGNAPITGMMADESLLRINSWLMNGCNAYDGKRKLSNPMAFWTEQDVIKYIYINKLPIASIYGEVVYEGVEDLFGEFHIKYKLTGLKRTGCMFCMFGLPFEEYPNRFQRMKKTHPKQYDYCMKTIENGGLGLDKVLSFMKLPH